MTSSTASSPTFWAILLIPFLNSPEVYDFSEFEFFRSEIISYKTDKKYEDSLTSLKQVAAPV